MLPIIAPYVTELREDAAVIAVIGVDGNGVRRVRAAEPLAGDAQGPGRYLPFMVLDVFDAPPEPDIPVTFATIGASCYGTTHQNAWAVYLALVEATHRVGPRLKDNGLGFYRSLVVSGGEQGRDPDTKQPVVRAVVNLIATTEAVAV